MRGSSVERYRRGWVSRIRRRGDTVLIVEKLGLLKSLYFVAPVAIAVGIVWASIPAWGVQAMSLTVVAGIVLALSTLLLRGYFEAAKRLRYRIDLASSALWVKPGALPATSGDIRDLRVCVESWVSNRQTVYAILMRAYGSTIPLYLTTDPSKAVDALWHVPEELRLMIEEHEIAALGARLQ